MIQQKLGPIGEWVNDRTGLGDAIQKFLLKDIPASAGWPHVFGSIALFLLFVQAITGVLLALNFAPTPHEAYLSLTFILRQVPAGRFVRGLHHWGSSFIIVAAMAHMGQVFVWAAYKKPRELTWLIGVLLLLIILAFGLTGYLLPWDNRAYWGTIVTTRILGSIPLAGPLATRLAGADHTVGAVTFARFYALHTLILPAAAILLVAFHLYLVQRHGVAAHNATIEGTQPFYPKQLWRDTIAIFLTFTLLFAAAAFVSAPLERMADPTDIGYSPRPEWYFLFLFQTLKFLAGNLEWIGTVALPSLTVLLLLGMPFWAGRLRLDRKLPAIALTVLAASIWTGLTVASARGIPKRQASVPASWREWPPLPPEEIAGMSYFQTRQCDSCHNLVAGVPKGGPNLPRTPLQHPRGWLIQHCKAEVGAKQPSVAAPSLIELNALLVFVGNVTPESAIAMKEMPPDFLRGVKVYVANACTTCHKVNNAGGSIGPALNGLAYRRSKQWVDGHFLAPQRLSPGSIMPPYRFEPKDREALVQYLFSLEE